MERFCIPNLPQSRVRKAFVSQLMPDELIWELGSLGISTYKLGKSANMSGELSYHPDILLNNFKKGKWLCENDPKYLPPELPKDFFIESETELGNIYPYDCPFNNFRLEKALICGRSADYLIRAFANYNECRIIYVPQNYTKCCSIPINKEAIITCDYSIGRALRANNYDVLTVEDSDEIGLKGYSHGLIGGCAGMLSNDLLGFTGDLNKYKYGKEIRDFCANHGVDAYSLSNHMMYDYGGILPITELVPKNEINTSDYCSF